MNSIIELLEDFANIVDYQYNLSSNAMSSNNQFVTFKISSLWLRESQTAYDGQMNKIKERRAV